MYIEIIIITITITITITADPGCGCTFDFPALAPNEEWSDLSIFRNLIC
jgi:hypothetical protein